MICRQCGNEMRDDARFCPHCGALNGPDAGGGLDGGGYRAPSYTGPEAPVTGGGKKKGLIIGGIVAAVAVIAVLAVVLSGLFSSRKGAVEKAMAKSFAAYAQAEEALGLPDLSRLGQEQSYSQGFSLVLNSVSSSLVGYDTSALSGLGLRMSADLSGKDRYLGFELSAFWDDEDLLNFYVTADDDELYFSSPQITGETLYGVNTETLGADIAQTTGNSSMEDFSFNIFELVDMVMEAVDPEVAEQAVKEANKALWNEAEVKKVGGKTLSVNGTEQKTTAYQVTFPQKAMEDYVDALAEVMSAMNYYDLYEELFRSMGMPREELEDFLSQLEDMDVYGELADDLKAALKRLGDLELSVCLYGGYVAAVGWEGRIDGSDVEMLLTLGGGEEYVDDLGLELEVDGTAVTVRSEGDHSCKNGSFTDKTTMRVGALKMTSEMSYDPREKGDNFSWELSIPGAGSVDMSGSLTVPNQDSVNLNLEDISMKLMGMEVCSLGLEYYAGPFQGNAAAEKKAEIITAMSEEELMRMTLDTQQRALAWADEMERLFASRLPEELLWAIMA